MRFYPKQNQYYNNISHAKLSTSINENEYLIIYTGWNIRRYTNKEQFKKDLQDSVRTLGLKKVEIGAKMKKIKPFYLNNKKGIYQKPIKIKKELHNNEFRSMEPMQLELF